MDNSEFTQIQINEYTGILMRDEIFIYSFKELPQKYLLERKSNFTVEKLIRQQLN